MGTLQYLKNGTLQNLGNIQTEFNLSFTIDGTKDSAKMEVVSFSVSDEIVPNTIVKHVDTNSWWVVANDKVEYFVNENNYLYKHVLKLQGLAELLNARDLTDCGFFADNYTIREFIVRLWSLSTIEYDFIFDVSSQDIDLDQNVDYTKSFENYTLLSALREFLDGYNMSLRLSMDIVNSKYVIVIHLISKAGLHGNVLNENVFTNVKQTRTIDKNSYGTTVVSNAENVISTKAKTYPSVGAVRLSSNSGTIDKDNAILRLPSDIYRINWVQIITPRTFRITAYGDSPAQYLEKEFRTTNDNKEYLKQKVLDLFYGTNYYQYIVDTVDYAVENMVKVMRTTLWTGWSYNAINNTLIPPKDNPSFYFPQYWQTKKQNTIWIWNSNGPLKIALKEERDTLPYPITCMYYERGKNYIGGFEMMGNADNSFISSFSGGTFGFMNTDLRSDPLYGMLWEDSHAKYQANAINNEMINTLEVGTLSFRVNYIPMTDLKVKYDNSGVGNDIQLYNQNGKLTDSVALSKLMLSYSKEIESDNITRFASFYDYSEVPQVGKMVNINNTTYVINNVALDFYPNESSDSDIGYYIVGEFTLSKKIATKSLMVNPNTNIRDYGIPQNLNVKRKQLYRDFYELSHTAATDSDNEYYLPLNKALNLTPTSKEYEEHIGVIKITYQDFVGGDGASGVQAKKNWYYQLDSTTYIMKKAIYEVIDFKDNNIIGYGSQNIFSGFDITRVLSGFYDTVNTPISYVDDNGKCKEIRIAWCSIAQLTKIYDDYKQARTITSDKSLYNYSCFIDSDIYEGISGVYQGAKDNCDFLLTESNYKKDTIEVPVFEYSCQIDDSDDVIVGDNVFSVGETNKKYLYSFALVEKNSITPNNFNENSSAFITPTYIIANDGSIGVYMEKTINNGVVEFVENNNETITLNLKNRVLFNIDTNYLAYTGNYDNTDLSKKDIVVIKNIITETEQGSSDIYYGNGTFEGGLGQELTYDSEEETFYLDLTALGYFPNDFNVNPAYLVANVSYIGINGTDITSGINSISVVVDNDHYIMVLDCTVSIPIDTPISIYFDIMLPSTKTKVATFKKELMFIIKNSPTTSGNTDTLYINHYKIK